MAKKLKLPLRLLHCMPELVALIDLPVIDPGEEDERQQLKNEADRLRDMDIAVAEEFRRGNASIEIMAAAGRQPTRLIVLGSVGKGRTERWLLGSVAERVAEGAAVPTLVVRNPELLLAWLSGSAPLRLLCGMDFTATADAAIASLRTFIGLGGVGIEAIDIHPAADSTGVEEQQSLGQRILTARLHGILGEVPVSVHPSEPAGLPASDFLQLATKLDAGLLMVGTHPRQGWQRLTVPSFSRHTLAHATTNVLCVPAAAATLDSPGPPIRRVLLATDFTAVCVEALRHAHSLLPSGGTIHIVHVCPKPAHGTDPLPPAEVNVDQNMLTLKALEKAQERMKALPASLLSVPGIAITSEVLSHHDPAAAICDAAARFGADVICMGTQGHSRIGSALMGSTVQSVLAHSHLPVFVVTPPLT